MSAYDDIIAQYYSLADDLIDSINPAQITLYYRPQELTANNAIGDGKPEIIDFLGGRVPITELDGRDNQTGQNLKEVPVTEVVKIRAYWESQNFMLAQELNLKNTKDLCKVICYTTDNYKLLNAAYGTIDGYKATMVRVPYPYGFTRKYSISYWTRTE